MTDRAAGAGATAGRAQRASSSRPSAAAANRERGREARPESPVRLLLAGVAVCAAGFSGGWLVTRRPSALQAVMALPPRLGAADAAPRAVFETTRRELGRLRTEETVEAVFPLRNAGSAPLRIDRVDVSCGCTAPEFPGTVAAGGSGDIRVRFSPGLSWTGRTEKTLTVHTNDPAQPRARLTLAADLLPPLACRPASTVLARFRPGKPVQREVRLVPRPDRKARVLRVVSGSPLVKAALKPPHPADPERAYRLQLTAMPKAEPGDYLADVRILTCDRDFPETTVTVFGQAGAGPVAAPAQVEQASIPLARAREQITQVRVFSRSGPVRVLRVDTGDPRLVAGFAPDGTVSLRCGADAPSGRLKGELRIHTDDRTSPVLAVPYDITVS